jgi:O-antigen/teichoic acid export membrane protein
VLTLMSGTVIAQAIPVLLSPVLSRIYSPAEFGVFSLFSSIASAAAVIATFRYELAIMLPEKEDAAISILNLCTLITLSLAAFFFAFTFVFHEQLPGWLHSPALAPFIYYVPLFLLFAGGTQALNYWISRHKKFKLLAAGKMAQTGTTGLIGIVLGCLNFSSLGLIIGAVAGQFSSLLIYMTGSAKRIISLQPHASKEKIRESFVKYKTFFFINTPHALLVVLQDVILVFLINYFFNSTILGWYAYGFRILKVPAGVIGAAVFQVYFQEATRLKNDPVKLQALTRRIYIRLFSIGLPLFTFLGIFAPQIFSLVLGKEWLEAGRIAQLLSPWLLLNFVISPCAALSIVLNRQQWAIWFAVVDTLSRSAAIIIGGLFGNHYLAFALLSIGSGSLLSYALYWYYRLPTRVQDTEPANKN